MGGLGLLLTLCASCSSDADVVLGDRQASVIPAQEEYFRIPMGPGIECPALGHYSGAFLGKYGTTGGEMAGEMQMDLVETLTGEFYEFSGSRLEGATRDENGAGFPFEADVEARSSCQTGNVQGTLNGTFGIVGMSIPFYGDLTGTYSRISQTFSGEWNATSDLVPFDASGTWFAGFRR